MRKILTITMLLWATISSAQKVTYEDSVKLFENTRDLKEMLIRSGYKKQQMDADDSSEILDKWRVIDAANHNNKPPKGMERRRRYWVGAQKEGNLYRVYDFFPGQINKKLGYQYFSPKMRPYRKDMWRHPETGDARLVYNYQNAKPFNYEQRRHKYGVDTPKNGNFVIVEIKYTWDSSYTTMTWFRDGKMNEVKKYTMDNPINTNN